MQAGDFYSMIGQRPCKTIGGLDWKCYKNATAFAHTSDDANLVVAMTFRVGGSQVIFSTPVYEFGVLDRKSGKAVRWLNPEFKEAYIQECEEKGINWKTAIDDLEYAELEMDYEEAHHEVKNIVREFYGLPRIEKKVK